MTEILHLLRTAYGNQKNKAKVLLHLLPAELDRIIKELEKSKDRESKRK
jgi:hypothetical protein